MPASGECGLPASRRNASSPSISCRSANRRYPPKLSRGAGARRHFAWCLPVLFLTADPGLAHLDLHQSIRIDLVGVLFEDCQVGEFARFKRAELVGHSDLTG